MGEYVLLLTIVMAAFLTASNYLKRGIQGKWKQAVDDLGEQYDPTVMDTNIKHVLKVNSETRIFTENTINGFWTNRYDFSNSAEEKTGYTRTGGY